MNRWQRESSGKRGDLGQAIAITLTDDPQPVYVGQYFTSQRRIGGTDPRQHAIGLTFALEISGEIRPQGEALDFRWFEPGKLPAAPGIWFWTKPNCRIGLGTAQIRPVTDPGSFIHVRWHVHDDHSVIAAFPKGFAQGSRFPSMQKRLPPYLSTSSGKTIAELCPGYCDLSPSIWSSTGRTTSR